MNRVLGPVLGLILLGIVIGFVLGVVVGVFVLPVSFTNTDVSNLRPAQKDDYVVMVSAAYALDNNLSDAKQRLARLDNDQSAAAKYVADVAQRSIDKNDTRNARNIAALAIALGAGTSSLRNYVNAASSPAPTPIATFTPTAAATAKPAALLEDRQTPTPTTADTDTPSPTKTAVKATSTARPPTATFTPAPPKATATSVPPTKAPQPAVAFKVIEQRMLSITENGGCAGNHTFYIKAVDINGVPLPNIIVERRYVAQVAVPPTGAKGPGRTEDEAGDGNAYHVLRDTGGTAFTSDWTREMSTIDEAIPNSDLIASGYCANDADCNARKGVTVNLLCRRHYSYSVTFQRQW